MTIHFDPIVSQPHRVQICRVKGWRMPENTVCVARPTKWGNPFRVSRWRDNATCIALFENSVRGFWNPDTSRHLKKAWQGYDEHFAWLKRLGADPLEAISELRGKNLACWCALDAPCHADVLLRLANDTFYHDAISLQANAAS